MALNFRTMVLPSLAPGGGRRHRFGLASRRLLPVLLVLLAPLVSSADDHAVILIYHHVADDTPESTSVTPERFAEHLDYLDANGFEVMRVEDVLQRLATGQPLPVNSVAITFDDAYLSVYNIARPMLDAREMPYSVFVTTEFIDHSYGNYMSWEQLRRVSEYGGSIGNHGVTHRSALEREPDESRSEWLARFREDAVQAQSRIEAETGVVSTVFAWPYGEYSADVEAVLKDLRWYGLGQQSGAAGYDDPSTAIPRFPISTAYSDLAAFATRVRAEPLPIEITNAPGRLLANGDAPPVLTFRLKDERWPLSTVNCFNSQGDPLDMQESDAGTVAVKSPAPLNAGRSKYTCTAPHPQKTGVFGWYSHLWVVADD